MQTYQLLGGCAPSSREDVYVFAIAPVTNRGLAAITSADELLLLNRDSLDQSDVGRLQGAPVGLTSLVVADQGTAVICAGGDGAVTVFDLRTRSRAAQFKSEKPVNALASRRNDVALGSESVVSLWDRRQTKIRWQNTEVNDEITALNFHPSRDNLLLSGGDDGLVCIFDTEVQEEQDSLLQAVNHGPIHKTGFLGSTDLYALSSDQNLALHSLTVDDVDVEADRTPAPDQLGDLRPAVPCEYVIDILQSGQDHVVACGSHSYSRVDLVKLDRGIGLSLDQRIVLEGAHGEEIVRSVYVDDENGTIFTAGEDGRVAAFRPRDSAPPVTPAKAKVKKVSDARYKPY
ncbi:putative WD repeat-containing protein [Cladophialophora carrionii]|uniref:Putative WD repeat-containing protein n=1 Tax=Cladophialophora carrionii TaxID=86049 RepID=A0A1C1CGT0_9EURO|nr:putative WD repeat-containing protein [Cladophialophora carrionii]